MQGWKEAEHEWSYDSFPYMDNTQVFLLLFLN